MFNFGLRKGMRKLETRIEKIEIQMEGVRAFEKVLLKQLNELLEELETSEDGKDE